MGAGPPTAWFTEPGEWQHGRQHHASSCSGYRVWEDCAWPNHAANQAHLRSHSGPCASLVLFGLPTSRVFEVKPHLFRTITLGRLRLPLMITEARCACRGALDVRGQHKAACPRSGRPPFTDCAHGAHPCPSVSRGGRHSEVQHQTAGHEPQLLRHRRTGD